MAAYRQREGKSLEVGGGGLGCKQIHPFIVDEWLCCFVSVETFFLFAEHIKMSHKDESKHRSSTQPSSRFV